MNKKTALGFILTATLLLGLPQPSRAQPVVSQAAASPEAAPTPIDMTADRLEFESDKNLLIGIGNVEVRHLGDYLRADYLEVNTETQDVYARGNVFLEQEGSEWEGQELRYNMKTKQGKTGVFKAFTDPYYVIAEDSERIDERKIKLRNAKVTTCEGDDPIFYIRAKEAILIDGNRLKSKSLSMHFLGVPFFWLPYLTKDMEQSNFDFMPGYSSRQGAFLLTRYNYRLNENLKGAVRLDLRSARGVGVGKDFLWEDPEETYSGEFNVYYLNDADPLDDEEDEAEYGDLVDENRYRVRLQHRQNLSLRDYVVADVNYLSDPLVLDDFFDKEFRKGSQPENRVSFTHRDDFFTAGGEVSVRLNDFYDNVNRMPELYLDVQRQQVYETDFYYESENSAGFYQRVYPDSSSREEYDAFRADTKHTIYYPTRHFGFLNVIPRAGYRGTYYSKTLGLTSVTNMVSTTNLVVDLLGTNSFVSTTNEVNDVVTEEGAGLRNLFEFGVETSFKAFKEIHNEPTIFGDGLRHVAEPFLNYTFVPDPNFEPDELPQFDSIDRLGAQNTVGIGVRNKLQTKNGTYIRDLVDAEISTEHYLDASGDEADFGPLEFDVELMPFSWLEVEFDGDYLYDQENLLHSINTEVRLRAEDRSYLGFEHRFEDNRRDLLSVEAVLFPQDVWSFGGYLRYDNEAGELEEEEISVFRKGECLGWGLGLRNIKRSDGTDDITVWAQLWLSALPETMLDLGR